MTDSMDLALHDATQPSVPARRLQVMMFGAGLYAMLSQIILLRELLVAFFGNELTIGAMLSAWLIGIGLGSLVIWPGLRRFPVRGLQWLVVILLVMLALLLPAQVCLIRVIRSLLHVPFGEYVPFDAMLVSTGLMLLPTCLSIGIIFPCACHLVRAWEAQAVGRVYAVESLGSMIGGGLFTFVFVNWLTPFATISIAGLVALSGAAIVAPHPVARRCLLLPILCLAIAACCPRCLAHVEWKSIEARWRALGCLPASPLRLSATRWRAGGAVGDRGLPAHSRDSISSVCFFTKHFPYCSIRSTSRSASGAPRHSLARASGVSGAVSGSAAHRAATPSENSARLVASVDSRYQNLAVIEAQGQMTLYGNGQVMAVFPDPISGEHKIHFIMAQNPDARTVLLIGGNPVTDIPELLKYPLKRLVHVELDQDISRLLDAVGGTEYRHAIRDPRFQQAIADGPRFVKTCRDRFDVVIIDAPEPTTIALNRFYTLDFYRNIRRCLTPGGFLYTSIEASEQLQDEAASLSASIHQSLKAVFSSVLVTAGTRSQFFAGMSDSPLTFDRQTLFQRSASAGLRHRYFRPEYFLNADEISPDKTDFVEQRLSSIQVPANTALRPISTFYHLTLWSRFSGSRLDGFLNGMRRIRFDWTCGIILAAGLMLLLVGAGLALGWQRPRSEGWRAACHPWPGLRRGWTRGMLGMVVASTGFCGMALELILIFVFQSLFGYVYARVGLIVAMFMLGLMLGAVAATRLTAASTRWTWYTLMGLELVLLGMAISIPFFMIRFSDSTLLAVSGLLFEGFIYGWITLVGGVVGAQFIVVNQLFRDTEVPLGTAAALANAADLFGAALGGFAVGVVLLPLWGIMVSCLLLAVLKVAGALGVISACLAERNSLWLRSL